MCPLRCGEMVALEWRDIDLAKRQVCVQRSEWKGQVTAPKGGRLRYVPLTARLAAALRDHRHLPSARGVMSGRGISTFGRHCEASVERSARHAGLNQNRVHRLRHTFCSHLAMRGAPARAIQELAGHKDSITTQRYMYLSPAALESAIRLLESAGVPLSRRHVGDGESLIRYLQLYQPFRWRGRRDSNPRPLP